MKVHRDMRGWEYWYDRSTRCWWAMRVENGCQVGDAVHAFDKTSLYNAMAVA